MANDACIGLMAVVAASSSVVFLAHQLHRRLASEYMKKIEMIYGNEQKKVPVKKKVRFAPDVVEPSSNNKEYRRRHTAAFDQVH